MAIKDKAASVLARLLNKAREQGVEHSQLLMLFAQEEFIRRLALSRYADNLVLKGGLLLFLLSRFEGRPTMDADYLLRHYPNDEASMRDMLEHIFAQETANDFMRFEIKSLKPIAIQQHYHGVTASLLAFIKQVRIPFSIDFGVGDVIFPAPERTVYDSLLSDQESPSVLSYSLESTIAEKYDAIVLRKEQTSRMKDFYDIYSLSKQRTFNGAILQKALRETLHYRGTRHTPETFGQITSLADNADMKTKWHYFLRDTALESIPFEKIIEGISQFLGPVIDAMVKDEEYQARWEPQHGWHS